MKPWSHGLFAWTEQQFLCEAKRIAVFITVASMPGLEILHYRLILVPNKTLQCSSATGQLKSIMSKKRQSYSVIFGGKMTISLSARCTQDSLKAQRY